MDPDQTAEMTLNHKQMTKQTTIVAIGSLRVNSEFYCISISVISLEGVSFPLTLKALITAAVDNILIFFSCDFPEKKLDISFELHTTHMKLHELFSLKKRKKKKEKSNKKNQNVICCSCD